MSESIMFWSDVSGFPDYEMSREGDIREKDSLKSVRIQTSKRDSYVSVSLFDRERSKKRSVGYWKLYRDTWPGVSEVV